MRTLLHRHRRIRLAFWTAGLAASLSAEIIDMVAARVDRRIITVSAIELQLRITSFLNAEPVDLSAASRRRMAERLIEQALIRKEMEVTRYQPSADSDIEGLYRQIRQERGPSDEEFRRRMAAYGISEAPLRQSLAWQQSIVRFVDLRFRPGTAVADGEIELYYRETYVPDWQRQKGTVPAPELDDVRDQIEAVLLALKANQGLEQWLRDARSQARIEYFEEAFR